MNRGVNRQDIFVDDVDRTEFLRLLGLAAERQGVEVHAYCLMSNHFHLLAHCPEGGVSRFPQWLTSQYASWFNDRRRRVGHLFGGRYSSRLVDTEAYCLNVVRYIHRNALDVAGVSTSADFRWSSHRSYLGFRRPPTWLTTEWILGWFDSRADFAAFVDGPESLPTLVDPTITATTLLDAVDAILTERAVHRSRALRSQRRAIALAVADQVGSPLSDRVHNALGLETPRAVTSASRRARGWRVEHPETEALVRLVIDLLATPMQPRRRAA
jgi:REP element-mobilizing transposase RayT